MAFTDQRAVALDESIVPPATIGRAARWAVAAGTIGACMAGAAFIYSVDPNAASNPYPRCLLKSLTGIDCPGCGGTRAMYSLLHGDVMGAVDHNILVFLVVPLFAYLALRFVAEPFGLRLPAPRLQPWMGWALAIFVIAFSVLRNLPIAPFHYFESGVA